MGIICLALIVTGHLDSDFDRPPTWVIVSAALAMALGTYAGGWRIIKTMGTRIAKIDPPQGFAAQTACAGILWTTAHYGFPVSTTQTITGCVMGAGASRRFSAVRWGVAGNIAVAWILTLPRRGVRRGDHGARHAHARGQPRGLHPRRRDRRGRVRRSALRDPPARSGARVVTIASMCHFGTSYPTRACCRYTMS